MKLTDSELIFLVLQEVERPLGRMQWPGNWISIGSP